MNLLPQPRLLEISGGQAPWREATRVHDVTLPEQGYRLEIAPGKIEIRDSSESGHFYGRMTLEQIRRLHTEQAPCLVITDWPDFELRGVMLDVSRDKVPTMATLKDLIRRLASWKYNHLQLYMEHTFAYRNHREVWEGADPFTPEEIAELDGFCGDLHIELAPFQNCLGHMERWLKHPRYRPLAARPDGTSSWGPSGFAHHPASTLDPHNPASLRLVAELLDELLPCFPRARHVFVGLDEPIDLVAKQPGGWGAPGLEDPAAYLDWMKTLRALPALDGRQMLISSDVLRIHPELLAMLPEGVTVCEWGYAAEHDFSGGVGRLAELGVPFWVIPSTSSQRSIVGRISNARGNLDSAAAAGLEYGAAGYLNTDWGPPGHLQYLLVSEPGFALGAALSWCRKTNLDLDLTAALSVHAFEDPTGNLAAGLVALGDLWQEIPIEDTLWRYIIASWISVLTLPLYAPEMPLGQGPTAAARVEHYEKAKAGLKRALNQALSGQPKRADGQLLLREMDTAGALLHNLIDNAIARLSHGGTLDAVPQGTRTELAKELAPLIKSHRELWLARNRPGGLEDSVGVLRRLLVSYGDQQTV